MPRSNRKNVARPQINIPPEASLRPLCERLAIPP
jgi:hypothetical protein